MDSLKQSRKQDTDDRVSGTEQCRKKIDLSSNTPGVSALCFIFCVAHGHCFGFHVVPLEGRKDAFLSVFAHMVEHSQTANTKQTLLALWTNTFTTVSRNFGKELGATVTCKFHSQKNRFVTI